MRYANKKIRFGLLYINNKKDKENGIDECDIAGKMWGGYNLTYCGLSKNHKQYGYKDERKYTSTTHFAHHSFNIIKNTNGYT